LAIPLQKVLTKGFQMLIGYPRLSSDGGTLDSQQAALEGRRM
jgi:hypothetical protein